MIKRWWLGIQLSQLNFLGEWLEDQKNTYRTRPKMLLLLAILMFAAAQGIAWLQINGQFVSEWCKNNSFLLSLLGIPISYLFIHATGLTFIALDNKAWPGRLLTFAVGIVVFTLLTWLVLGEQVTWKTALSLFLTCIIIALQIW
jgi:hypothetical protein